MYTRTATDVLRDTISRETGFDNGELFASEDAVRAYFTAENMSAMFGPDAGVPDDATLDAWADIVISNRWHCDFWTRRDAYVGVRLPPELLARIRAAADADDVTVSDVVRRVLRAALAADVDARVP